MSMNLFERMNFPAVRIAPVSATGPFEIDVIVVDEAPYLGDASSQQLVAEAAERTWSDAVARGQQVFNRPGDEPGLVRCLGIREAQGGLVLEVQPTWYWTWLGTNVQLRAGAWPGHGSMTEAEQENLANLRGSRLANCLSVDLVVLSGDDPPRALIQRRAKGAIAASIPYQCSAGGFVDLADVRNAVQPITAAAVREAREEAGLSLDPASISWIAIGRDTWACGVAAAGFCNVNERSDQTDLIPEQQEVADFEWWEFTPESLMRQWKRLGHWYAMVPLGGFAILATLASLYGYEEVVRAWEAAGQIPLLPDGHREPSKA